MLCSHIFKDIQTGPKEDVLTRKKEGKNREGYDPEMGVGLHRSVGVQQFVESDEPTQLLTVYNRIDVIGGELCCIATTATMLHCYRAAGSI